MSTRTRLIVFFASIPVIAFTLIGGYLGRVSAGEDTYRHLRIFEDVVSLISNNYVEEVDLDDVMHGALRGLTEGLDAESAYLSQEDVDRLESGRPLPEGGVGLTVTRRYYVQVVAAHDGSPAADAGILPGDFLRAIDGEPTRRMSAIEGERRLRGEPGSTVTLSLIRGSTQEPFDIDLVRTRVGPVAVAGRVLNEADGIGYIRIPGFGDDVVAQISDMVASLTERGASHLIIDVRNAARGTYRAAVDAARLFVDDGTLVIREEQGGNQTPLEATAGGDAISTPATVLVNFGSSGPAELFAAALSERDRATTIGQRTAGRAPTPTSPKAGSPAGWNRLVAVLCPLPEGLGRSDPSLRRRAGRTGRGTDAGARRAAPDQRPHPGTGLTRNRGPTGCPGAGRHDCQRRLESQL